MAHHRNIRKSPNKHCATSNDYDSAKFEKKMNLNEWKLQIAQWRIQYGVPLTSPKYEPAKIKVTCKKCKKSKHRMARHHKANDYLFANLLPDIYAKRYLEFRKEDIDNLCSSCHKRWHTILKPIINELLTEVSNLRKVDKEVDEKWCEAWRKKILVKYESWVSKPIRGRSKKK